MGQEPSLYRGLEDMPSDGYCVKMQFKNNSSIQYDYLDEVTVNEKWKSNPYKFETCATDYCNEPPNPPPKFTPKINAVQEPSRVSIKCWETLKIESDPVKNFNQFPKKSALAKGIGFCGIIIYVHRDEPKVAYGYISPEWNAYLSTGKAGYIMEYYSCNKFYCNDPTDPSLPGLQYL